MNDVVTLNVGGRLFFTTTSNLRKYPTSTFAEIFNSNGHCLRDKDGNIFIDRNGDLFEYVLDFMRNGSIPKRILDKQDILKDLMDEANYFKLDMMNNIIKNTVSARMIMKRSYAKKFSSSSQDYGDVIMEETRNEEFSCESPSDSPHSPSPGSFFFSKPEQNRPLSISQMNKAPGFLNMIYQESSDEY